MKKARLMSENPKIVPVDYTRSPSCADCHWNENCICGELGDFGICKLYKDGSQD